jgi:integrase
MSPLREALRDYLAVRRRLGFSLVRDGRMLDDFVAFLESADAPRITSELALAWAARPGLTRRYHCHQRLTIVRGFARYLAVIDPESEIPASELLPARYSRVTPYLYEPEEIVALMAAARELSPPLRGASVATVIGLLAVTGGRIGETLALDRGDVDLDGGVVHVRVAKRSRPRELPLHPSTTDALARYARLRDQRWPVPKTEAFFINTRGQRLMLWTMERDFRVLVDRVGLQSHGARCRPRAHDLRHAFAVRTLLDWYRDGEDVDQQMPLLSTYLGHSDPANTYWYLQAAPELLALISERLDRLEVRS